MNICNENLKIERCIICTKHLNCERENKIFTIEDFENYKNNPNIITIAKRRKYTFIDKTN